MRTTDRATAPATVDTPGIGTPPDGAPGTHAGAPGRRGRWPRLVGVPLLQIGLLLLLAVVWEIVGRTGALPEAYVSRPSQILPALWDGLVTGTDLRSALGVTLYETVLGFVIASAAGFGCGVLFYHVPLLERVWRPFVSAANNMPRLALTPLFVLWLGVGTSAHVVLIITMVFFVVLLNTLAGFATSSRDHLVLARVLGASRVKLYRRFLLPSAVPSIFVGLQLGLTYSFMGAVIGEMITGGQGLGAQIAIYSATYASDKVFADLLLMAIVAALLSGAIKLLEARLLRWRTYELRSAK